MGHPPYFDFLVRYPGYCALASAKVARPIVDYFVIIGDPSPMTDLPATEPPSDRRARTRQALVGAGLRLLAQRPIDAIAIDEIVAEAGVGKGSFYNHFDDKAALAGAIAAAIRIETERAVAEANAGVEDPARRVARALCVYLGRAVADPRQATVMSRTPIWTEAASQLNRGVLGDVSAGLLQGRFQIPTAEAGVLLVLGVAHVALARILEEPSAAVTLGQQLCGLLLKGLGLPAAEAEAVSAQAAHEILAE
jgi:AcrR family transcriptional regulator